MQFHILGSPVHIDETYVDESPTEVDAQLREYARGDRRAFELSVRYPDGFLGDVLAAIATIPYAETRTYGDLAADLDTAPVAVGQACGRNPVPIVLPCHRVVGSDGSLRGYGAGDGVATKRRLLELESRVAGRSTGDSDVTLQPRPPNDR